MWHAALPGSPEPAPKRPDPDPAEPRPPNPIVEQADENDDPAVDEVEIMDMDEFGEPIDESAADEDADDGDSSEI